MIYRMLYKTFQSLVERRTESVTVHMTTVSRIRNIGATTMTAYRIVAGLQMQCMYRPVIPRFSFCIFHTEIGTVLEARARI